MRIVCQAFLYCSMCSFAFYDTLLIKNLRPPAEVAPAPSRGHPHTLVLLVVADFGQVVHTGSIFTESSGYV